MRARCSDAPPVWVLGVRGGSVDDHVTYIVKLSVIFQLLELYIESLTPRLGFLLSIQVEILDFVQLLI